MVLETPLQFGVAERLSRTFRAESMGIRAEAQKMLWVDSVSTTYLIYLIPYVLIGLRTLEEEWRRKDTSLTHLKIVFIPDTAITKADTKLLLHRAYFSCSWDTLGISTLKRRVAAIHVT
ncbi:hypothetical protein Tco_0184949 [Tanacetum coccineum]